MKIFQDIGTWFVENGAKLALTICLIVIAICLMMLINAILKRTLLKTKLDNAVISFIVSVFKIIYIIVLISVVAGILELDTSSLLVSLSTLALAVGLALKDSFSNLANGVLILVNKPFKSGDHVSIGGIEGRVWNVKLLTVELVTFDNNKIVLPSSTVLNSDIVNYSAFPVRRVDLVFSVAYGSDMDKVESVLKNVIADEPLAKKNLEPAVFMSAHSASSIDYTVRVWVDAPNYATVKALMMRKVYDAFEKEKLSIPFPQIDVHIDKA